MKNKEFISELSNRLGWDIGEVNNMLAAFTSIVANRLLDDDVVSLQGFGQFEVKKKAERISVNPVTRKRYLIPPKLVPVFKPTAVGKAILKEL